MSDIPSPLIINAYTPIISPASSHRTYSNGIRIPRPSNAFMIFRSMICQQYRDAVPPIKMHQAALSAHISALWKSLSPEGKAVYDRLAAIKKQEHAHMYPEYRYQPRSKEQKAIEKQARKQAPKPKRTKRSKSSTTPEMPRTGLPVPIPIAPTPAPMNAPSPSASFPATATQNQYPYPSYFDATGAQYIVDQAQYTINQALPPGSMVEVPNHATVGPVRRADTQSRFEPYAVARNTYQDYNPAPAFPAAENQNPNAWTAPDTFESPSYYLDASNTNADASTAPPPHVAFDVPDLFGYPALPVDVAMGAWPNLGQNQMQAYTEQQVQYYQQGGVEETQPSTSTNLLDGVPDEALFTPTDMSDYIDYANLIPDAPLFENF